MVEVEVEEENCKINASGTSVASCSVGHKGENRVKQEKEPSKTQGSHGLGKN